MRLTPHVRTSALASLALVACLVMSAVWSGCRSDQWKTQQFAEARLRFMLPESWSVHLMRPGQEPAPLDPTSPAADTTGDGAVVTALSVLEDAAMVIFAPQKDVEVTRFARYMKDFIPLDEVRFLPAEKLYSKTVGGLPGFIGEGSGKLPKDQTPVYFRCLAVDVEGQPVFVILYAEESQQKRYAPIFERILESIEPTFTPRVQVRPDPGAAPGEVDPEPDGGAPKPPPSPEATTPPPAPEAPPGADAPDAGSAPPGTEAPDAAQAPDVAVEEAQAPPNADAAPPEAAVDDAPPEERAAPKPPPSPDAGPPPAPDAGPAPPGASPAASPEGAAEGTPAPAEPAAPLP